MAQDYCKFETVTIEGVDYISPDVCSFGDYGGAGSVGKSNIESIVESAGDSIFDTWFQDISRASESDKAGSYAMDSELELRAAIKAKRKPLVLHVTGGHSSETVYILRHSLLAHETLTALASYPSLDDERVSAIESEWESEAWDSWLMDDLEQAAWNDDDEPAGYSDMSDDDKRAAYAYAMEIENEYPTPEYSGVHVDVSRIKSAYRQTIDSMLAGETIDSLSRKRWPSLYAAPASVAESA